MGTRHSAPSLLRDLDRRLGSLGVALVAGCLSFCLFKYTLICSFLSVTLEKCT